jgi:hypothetical protein
MRLHLVKTVLMAFSLVIIIADVSFAGDPSQLRQSYQKNRIYQGVRKGEITKRDFTHLLRQQRSVEKYRNQALRDDNLSRKESRHLNQLQDRASGSIYRNRLNGYHHYRHDQHKRQRYSGPVYGHGYTLHRNYRFHSGNNFYSIWALPGWAFGFSSYGR